MTAPSTTTAGTTTGSTTGTTAAGTTAAGTTTGTNAAADPRIAALRDEIDTCDAEIIALVQRRLAISREIGSIRAQGGGTRLSLAREAEVLHRFRLALGPDGAALGMMLLRQGRGRL